MKRTICALLALCLVLAAMPALALTGEEALGLTGADSSTASGMEYPTLQIGSRDGDDAGAYVVMLQNRLAELGYLASAADGSYGSKTESAVINFQETNELTPTGIADSTTQSVLYSSSAQKAEVRAVEDNDTLRVQQALTRWGFMCGTVDGISGEATETGIAEFKNYLAANPMYASYTAPTPNPEPLRTLAPGEQPIAEDVALTSTVEINGQSGELTDYVLRFVDGEYPFQVYRSSVQSGSSGDEVWRVQRRLHQLNYLYKPDGGFGKVTELALKYFQKKHGIKQTGIADAETQEKLFSAEAKQAEEYVFPYKIGVSLKAQRVYIYGWDGSGYNKEIGSCKCSTGQPGYETPKGIYQSGGRITTDEWYYFTEYNTYAKYAVRIVGGVLFHSVLYKTKKSKPTGSSVRALGRPVSHGCVRLPEANAKWIYDNCAEGTTVVIY